MPNKITAPQSHDRKQPPADRGRVGFGRVGFSRHGVTAPPDRATSSVDTAPHAYATRR